MGSKATTVKDQISLLKSRGLIINDDAKAEEILLDIGYYRLGFYWHYLQDSKNQHVFTSKVTLDEIVKLYYFDFDIKHLLSKYIYRIEVHFRTQILYFVSNHYQNNNIWYVDPTIVNSHIFKEFNNIYFNLRKNRVLSKHHTNYKDTSYAPAWKTFEFLTFGQIFKFYSNLKNTELKKKIAAVYEFPDFDILENYFTAIIRIRNICSHNGVLYDYNQPVNIWKIPNKYYRVKNRNNNNLNASIRLIMFILSKISSNRAAEMEQNLKALFKNLDCCNDIKNIITDKINFDL